MNKPLRRLSPIVNLSMNRHMNAWLMATLIYIGGLTVSRGNQPMPLSSQEKLMIGTWEVQVPGTERRIVVRRPDHTFRENVVQIKDYSQPLIRYTANGNWTVEKHKICKTYVSITPPYYKSLIDQKYCEKILELTAEKLIYFPKDSPAIIEMRIDDVRARQLNSSPLQIK